MKIALVAQRMPWPVTPVDNLSADQAAHVAGLGRALAAQGHQVVIYARQESPPAPGKMTLGRGLSAELIPAGPPAPVTPDEQPRYTREIGVQLIDRWRRNTPDIVHAHYWTSGLAALFAAREVGVPVVQTFGSLAVAERRHGVPGLATDARIRLESCLARDAAGILAASSEEAEELTRLGIRGPAVTVIPSGVDPAVFRPSRVGRAVRSKGGRGPGAAALPAAGRLLHLGSLAQDQGLDVVLRALSQLPDSELVIAGGPPLAELESDAGYRVLAKLAAGLGVSHRVRFTGQVSEKDLPALLAAANVLVSAARHEPLGLRAVRAMACGLPVVGTATGGYADAVIDGTTGLLIPPGRPGLLLQRVHSLLGNPMQATAFGIAAADRAKSRYSWDRIARETCTAYRRCLAEPTDLTADRDDDPSDECDPASEATAQPAA